MELSAKRPMFGLKTTDTLSTASPVLIAAWESVWSMLDPRSREELTSILIRETVLNHPGIGQGRGAAGAARRRDGGMERRGCGSMTRARLVQEHKQQALSGRSQRLVLGPRVVTVHETKHLIVCPASIVWGCLVIATGS